MAVTASGWIGFVSIQNFITICNMEREKIGIIDGGVYYRDSHFGYAWHEGGVLSSMILSDLLGGEIPWKK